MKKTKPEELKELLFETITGIKSGAIDLEEARTMAMTSNAICKVVTTEMKLSEFNSKRIDKQKEVGF